MISEFSSWELKLKPQIRSQHSTTRRKKI